MHYSFLELLRKKWIFLTKHLILIFLIYYTSDIVKSVFGRSIITTLEPRITEVDLRDDIDVVKVRMESLLWLLCNLRVAQRFVVEVGLLFLQHQEGAIQRNGGICLFKYLYKRKIKS